MQPYCKLLSFFFLSLLLFCFISIAKMIFKHFSLINNNNTVPNMFLLKKSLRNALYNRSKTCLQHFFQLSVSNWHLLIISVCLLYLLYLIVGFSFLDISRWEWQCRGWWGKMWIHWEVYMFMFFIFLSPLKESLLS